MLNSIYMLTLPCIHKCQCWYELDILHQSLAPKEQDLKTDTLNITDVICNHLPMNFFEQI